MRSIAPIAVRVSLLAMAVFVCQLAGCGGGADVASSDSAAGGGADNTMPPGDSGGAMMPPGDDMGGGAEMMGGPGGEMGMEGSMEGENPDGMMMSGGADGMGMDPAMMEMAGEPGGYGGNYGGGNIDYPGTGGAGGGYGGNARNGRPNDVTQWTDEHILTAVDEKDTRVLQAIEMKAKSSPGDPAFVSLMDQVLAKTDSGGGGLPGLGSGAQPGTAGFPSGPRPQAGPDGKPPVPPGGAFIDPRSRQFDSNRLVPQDRASRAAAGRSVTSLDAMIGEALLAYVPQAAQGTRGAASRLQNSAQNTGSMEAPGMDPAMMSGEPGGEMSMPGGEEMGGMEMEGYNPGGYGPSGYGGAGGMGMGGQQATQGNLTDEELVKAVIRALVNNNTVQAWTIVQSLVDGSRSTALPPQAATEIAVREAFSSPTPNIEKSEQLLATALQNASGNPGQNGSTFQLLAIVAQRPADYFLSLGQPQPPAPATPPGNRPGMGMMGGGAGMGPGMGMDMGMGMSGGGENYAGGEPGMEMGMYGEGGPGMGGPGMGGRGAAGGATPTVAAPPPIPVAEAALLPVAQVIWAPSTADRVAGWLKAAPAADAAIDVLAFAGTIPSDNVRRSVFDLLSRSHDAGADGLVSSGLFRHFARDPGMLSVLKALPRNRRKPANDNPQAVVPLDSWERATQDVVLSLRERLQKMAGNPDLAYDGVMPVRLHRDAVPESLIRIVAPGPQTESLGDAAPDETKVYYAKMIATPQRLKDMQKLAEHYQGRTKGIEHKDIAKGLLWFDGVKVGTDGTITTMDVVFEQLKARPNNNGGFGGGGEGMNMGGGAAGANPQFSIEVIVVESRDPSKTDEPPAVTASAK
ncbi:hypothetical protein [Fuerstiella marisgermanici]|uniref:Uncharacterized protein n=1 Tax=Fuerstiella marisgermanici TaxID=1891926 RepID=A0A1P8WIT9_9PLAN|nr:hypothetical protein [Fuerstiella marisgermanici]APZ93957.1 hypothetical protein Fuma_03575 [Fuerstiella marisgermanici]